jgi:DNA-binding beta-propeller fold protein YncE
MKNISPAIHILSILAAFVLRSEGAAVLYVSNHDSGRVSTIDPVSGDVIDPDFITTPGQPHGILQIGNELLVASWGVTSRIARHDATTGAFLGIFADETSMLNHPVDLRVGPDNMVWVSSQANGRINRYDPVTGAAQTPFIAAEAHLTNPSGITFSPDGSRFFVVDRFDGEVLEYNLANGAYLRTLTDFSGPAFGIEWGPDQNLYVASAGLHSLSPTAPFATAQVAAGQFAIGVGLGPDGRIYFADYSVEVIRSFDPATSMDLGVFSDDPSLNGPNFFHFGVPEPSTGALVLSALMMIATNRHPVSGGAVRKDGTASAISPR